MTDRELFEAIANSLPLAIVIAICLIVFFGIDITITHKNKE